jgi:hypothetical protein
MYWRYAGRADCLECNQYTKQQQQQHDMLPRATADPTRLPKAHGNKKYKFDANLSYRHHIHRQVSLIFKL